MRPSYGVDVHFFSLHKKESGLLGSWTGPETLTHAVSDSNILDYWLNINIQTSIIAIFCTSINQQNLSIKNHNPDIGHQSVDYSLAPISLDVRDSGLPAPFHHIRYNGS